MYKLRVLLLLLLRSRVFILYIKKHITLIFINPRIHVIRIYFIFIQHQKINNNEKFALFLPLLLLLFLFYFSPLSLSLYSGAQFEA